MKLKKFLKNILECIIRPFCKHKCIIEEFSVKEKYIRTSALGNQGKYKLVYNIYKQNKCNLCGKLMREKCVIRRHLTKYQCEYFFKKL